MDTLTFKASQTYPGYALPNFVDYAKLRPSVEHAMVLAQCTTVLRRSGFLAQTGAESGSYRWMEELADGSAYEWRSDLGNNRPGDGRRYKGRGPIQLTGRHNYTSFSKWAYKNRAKVKSAFGIVVPNALYYVAHPQLLSLPNHGMLGTVWYWVQARNMNSYCDRNDIVGMTRAVNGGYNNLSGRTKRFVKCKGLKNRLLPDKSLTPKPAPKPVPKPKPTKPVVVKPTPAKPKPPTKKSVKPGKRAPVKYKVKSGDTLGAIAYTYSKKGRKVTWQEIKKASKIKNENMIHVNDILTIP